MSSCRSSKFATILEFQGEHLSPPSWPSYARSRNNQVKMAAHRKWKLETRRASPGRAQWKSGFGHEDEGNCRNFTRVASRDLRGLFSRTVKYLINPLLALSHVVPRRRRFQTGCPVSIETSRRTLRKKGSLMTRKRLIKKQSNRKRRSFLSTWTDRNFVFHRLSVVKERTRFLEFFKKWLFRFNCDECARLLWNKFLTTSVNLHQGWEFSRGENSGY